MGGALPHSANTAWWIGGRGPASPTTLSHRRFTRPGLPLLLLGQQLDHHPGDLRGVVDEDEAVHGVEVVRLAAVPAALEQADLEGREGGTRFRWPQVWRNMGPDEAGGTAPMHGE